MLYCLLEFTNKILDIHSSSNSCPINYQKTSNDREDVKNITTLINKEFEKWIKEKPEEWLLFHRKMAKYLIVLE